ncbi:hypothetical protein EV193_101583 [Herbihabitans rhizosphaerae]|uniref:Parallel beta helix pectate lyase-like protein n=1 Tax=Herbihabitans rhizosphaerae TaxID=1872711 RepID=A0A4Q7L5U8_9PSEU|nr:hypothetical protein [Herbihabitans rhizosphaerae]RZS44707.1 hypothetical protein EV193_101583 [Herbihabitans rhizosphaerae]
MARFSRRAQICGVALAAAGVLATVVSAQAAPSAAPDAVFTLYMAPGGSDGNDGRTPAKPIASLARAQQILLGTNPSSDVEVRIRNGVYDSPPLGSWTFYVPGKTVSFLPEDYQPGDTIDDIAGRSTFRNPKGADGKHKNGAWLTARLGGSLPNGGTSGLRFTYLQVENYSDGLGLMGLEYGKDTDGGNPPYFKRTSEGLNGNQLMGMRFRQIGTKWTGDNRDSGYGAIVLTNSSDNRITNSHFENIENAGDRAGMIHGGYVTHFSNQNVFAKNRYVDISGEPAKVRDRSSLNSFEYSTFIRTGPDQYYRDDVCDQYCYEKYKARAKECAGHHNRFIENTLESVYGGGKHTRVWMMWPWKPTPEEALRYAGDPDRCKLPAGETRLRTWGNKG